MADADIKQVTRGDAGWIVIVILRARRRYYQIRTILGWGASGERCREGRSFAPTEQSSGYRWAHTADGSRTGAGLWSKVHRGNTLFCDWQAPEFFGQISNHHAFRSAATP